MWNGTNSAPVTPFGQLPFFIEFAKQGRLFDGMVADGPLHYTSPWTKEARRLGTILLSVLAGYWRYAHMTTVNPPLLGMTEVVCADAVRRGLDKIDEEAGETWLQGHLDYTTPPLLSEPWILDIDTTVKPLYGVRKVPRCATILKSQGVRRTAITATWWATCGRCWGLMSRRVTSTPPSIAHRDPWKLLEGLAPEPRPRIIRGDSNLANEPVMLAAEQRGQDYLFKFRLMTNVKRAIERAMCEQDWQDAADGKDGQLRLQGWSRQRRVVILRRRLGRSVALAQLKRWASCVSALPRLMMAVRSGNTPFSYLARGRDPFYRSALSRPCRLRETSSMS